MVHNFVQFCSSNTFNITTNQMIVVILFRVTEEKETGLDCGRLGMQDWRSGESIRLPPMWPGFHSRTCCRMLIEFAGSLLCSERFFFRILRFASLFRNQHYHVMTGLDKNKVILTVPIN